MRSRVIACASERTSAHVDAAQQVAEWRGSNDGRAVAQPRSISALLVGHSPQRRHLNKQLQFEPHEQPVAADNMLACARTHTSWPIKTTLASKLMPQRQRLKQRQRQRRV